MTAPESTARRASRTMLAGGVALVLAMLSLALRAGPASAASAALSVSPSSGLKSGQTVTVTGSGFAVHAGNINVVQCRQGAGGASACNINAGKFFTKTDGSGGFSVQLTVAAKFGSTDCTQVACMIVAHAGTNPDSGTTAEARIRFGTGSASSSAAGPGGTTAPSLFPTGAAAGKGVRAVPESVVIAAALAAAFLLLGAAALVLRLRARRH